MSCFCATPRVNGNVNYPVWVIMVCQRIRLQCRRMQFDSWVGKIPWRRDRLPTPISWASLVTQMIKNPLAMWETQVQSLGQEDTLEEDMATHSSILAWRIPWTKEPGGLQSWGRKESDTTEQLRTHSHYYISISSYPFFLYSIIAFYLHM